MNSSSLNNLRRIGEMKNCFLSSSSSSTWLLSEVKKNIRYKGCALYRFPIIKLKNARGIPLATSFCRKQTRMGLSQNLRSHTDLQYTPSVKGADTVLHSVLKLFDVSVHFCHNSLVFVAERLGLHSWFDVVPSDGKRLLYQTQIVTIVIIRELAVLLFLVQVWPKVVRYMLHWLRKAWIQFDFLGTKVLNKVAGKEIKDEFVTSVPWSDTILKAAEQPLILSLWIFALLRIANLGTLLGSSAFYALENILHVRIGDNVVGYGLGKLSFVLLFGWFLERWRKLLFQNVGSNMKNVDSMDRSLFLAYERLMQAVNYLIISFLLYEYVGLSFAPIFAISGLGGIALSLAARDFVSNVFGSIMIYLTRPFTVGDKIRSRDGSVNGCVEKIGWYSSEVLNDEGLVVFVPNSTFTSAVITNLSRMKQIPFQRKISLSKVYLQNMDRILDDIRKKIESFSVVDFSVPPTIYVTDVRDDSIEIEVRCVLKNSSQMDEKLARQNLIIELGELEQQLRVAGAA
ncbi:Low conductance mechanosensitive channel YnaI [Galdieria sulphuraria]|nr:Low conductance mechanosensitive channel YnaI [Galdieria sulphuraria]